MTFSLEEIRSDISAFADDEEDVVVEPNGDCIFVRGGVEMSFQVAEDEHGRLIVGFEDQQLAYRDFLSRHLGRLDVLADRIVAKRPPIATYVDSEATMISPGSDKVSGRALDLLHAQCTQGFAFAARVVFVTADAGQGKTALLRQYQHQQAERFVAGKSPFVFWHVDLQGRQLLRLSEALMGDLSDVRVSGLWMPAVLRLLRHRALVLAIDGFDELAAEQGGTDALGALAMLVQRLGDRGTIVAASRRTFFDTDDYVSRAKLFSRTGGGDCQFDQLSLQDWGRDEGITYLARVTEDERSFDDPTQTYCEIVRELGSDDHTMVTRPFLLAQVARALLRFRISATDFIRGMDDRNQAVGAVIENFVAREVSEKWKQKDTGEPFLTADQHLRLLADVAEEMFRAQRATLDVETVETIAALLLDEWQIDQVLRQQILEMVRMHVLLTPPAEGHFGQRSFDHEEFRDWFTGYALKDRLVRLGQEGGSVAQDLLSAAQLPDATARHACALVERTPQLVDSILRGLVDLATHEWRPTYLQLNCGTLVPFLLDGVEPAERFTVDARMVYSSLVFENTRLTRVDLNGGTFLNASFHGVDWDDVHFIDCDVGEPSFSRQAHHRDVSLRGSRLEGLRLVDGDDEVREYAPIRIQRALSSIGVTLETTPDTDPRTEIEPPNGDARRLTRRLLNAFRRTTIISETVLKKRFPRDAAFVFDVVIPLTVKHNVLVERAWRGSGSQSAWGLDIYRLEEIERADGEPGHPLHAFWQELDALDARAGRRR